uniref:FA complementation group I n=1 Tax=Tetraodon nigroviridis TaxID=99883 RepID=H3D3N5_TETNG
ETDKIVALSERESNEELQKYLSSLTRDRLTSVITHASLKGKHVGAVIKGIFHGSPAGCAEGSARRLLLYQHCVPLCQSGDLQPEVAADIVGLLMLETHSLPGSCLAQLATLFLEAIKGGKMGNGKSLELFPTVLTALSACESLSYGKGELSGEEYKKQLINTLCSSRWDPQCVIHLTTMFRDVPLSVEELRFLVEKVLRMLTKLDLQEVPPLVYQLLLLSAKGCKKQILDGIVTYFKDQDVCLEEEKNRNLDLEVQSLPQDELRHVEGTAILHIVFALRLDHELGREFLKAFKVTSYGDLCPFSVALLLSVARIQRYEEQVFDILKATIIRNFKDEQLLQGSDVMKTLVPDCPNVAQMILETVRNSMFGWDHVTQGLVQLGFVLMDGFGPKPGPFGKTAEGSGAVARTPAQQACKLGRQVLLEGFKMHEPVRGEILEQVLNRLVTKTASPVSHYLDLFSDVVNSAPMIVLESSSKVTETFDHLSYLPLATVQGLLKALQPLLKVSMTLKDALILVLRKAMFSSQLDGRKSAVTGFLLLLKNFKVLGSLASSQCSQAVTASQVQVDVHSRYNAAANEAFCLEILSSLRRCLSQQADVRLLLYEGFYDVLRRNSQLSSSVMQTLLSQVKRYYEPEKDLLPPVKLEPCITALGDQVYLQEPLGHLLSCAVHCLLWLQKTQQSANSNNDDSDDEEEDEGYQSELHAIFESMTGRMLKSELEDFELDKSAEFSMVSSVGVKNNIYAVLVMGVYEVLLEYNFTEANYSKSRFEDVMELFSRYNKLSEILKEKAGKGRASSHKTPRSLLSMGFISTLLPLLFSVLMWYYTNIPSVVEDAGKREKRSSLSLLCLEGLLKIFTTCQQRFPQRMTQLLSNADVAETGNGSDDTDINFSYIRRFQKVLFDQLGEDGDEFNSKEAQLLVSILAVLSQQLDPSSDQYNEITEIIGNVCKKTSLEDLAFVKGLLSLFFNLYFALTNPINVLLELCQDIHSELGDIDPDVEVDKQCHFAIVNTKTATTVALLVMSQVDRVLDEVDWLIARKKSQTAVGKPGSGEASATAGQQDKVEKTVMLQLGRLLTGLHELVQTSLPQGSSIVAALRALTRTYNILTTLAKYYVQVCSTQQSTLPPRFEKLVRLSGSHLTPQCYTFITYAQSGEISGNAEDKKKKKNETNAAASAKLLRETKAIPNLIFSIEQYEKYLITLSKKSKVNLMQYMKLSTSRDFRINAATLEAALQEQDDSPDTTESQQAEGTQEPQQKKRKH